MIEIKLKVSRWFLVAVVVLLGTAAFATITISSAPVTVNDAIYARQVDFWRADAGTIYFGGGERGSGNPNLAFGTSSDPMMYFTLAGPDSVPTLVTYLADIQASGGIGANTGYFFQGIPSYGSMQLGFEDPDPIITFQEDTTLSNTNTGVASIDALGYFASTTPFYWPMFVGAAITVADFGSVTPQHDTTVVAATFNVTAGVGGNTDAIITISDGMATCDCPFACDTGGALYVACAGTCDFLATTPLTFSVSSAGDCATPPTIVGNVSIEYNWQ